MSNELTAELRFWWPGEAPAAVADWFLALKPGDAEKRRDTYSRTGRPDWGIKQRGRGGSIESKIALAVPLQIQGLPDARLWLKQEVDWERLPGGTTVLVSKERRLRSIADAGGEAQCEIELGRVRAGEGAGWTSLCFEAQADLSDPLRSLTIAWSGGRGLPGGLDSAWCASYPEWLLRVAGSQGGEAR